MNATRITLIATIAVLALFVFAIITTDDVDDGVGSDPQPETDFEN